MSARFLHTADWHLGKPFNHIPGDAGAVLREARFEAVARIAALARQNEVDAVLVAGDSFDDNLVAERTLVRAILAMSEFQGPWIVIPGNHDAALAESVWTRLARLGLPENIKPALRAEPMVVADGRWTVLPAPLTERRTMDDATVWMNGTQGAGVRVGLAHGSVKWRLPESAQITNPIDPDRARHARLDYLALGDWHGCREVAPVTWYAGTPEADGWRASESGRALLVEIAGPGAPPRIEAMPIGRFAWHDLALDLTQGETETALEALMASLQPLQRSVLALRLTGSIGLEGREALDRALAHWSPKLHHLEWDDTDLLVDPGDHDLLTFGADPLVAAVADRLRARLAAGDEPDREAAGLALRFLWRLTREIESPQ